MQKGDFETYQKRFRDFEILPKFSETHVFQGTIRHPYMYLLLLWVTDLQQGPSPLKFGINIHVHFNT